MYLAAIQTGASLLGGVMKKGAADDAVEDMEELLDEQLMLKEYEFQENRKRQQKQMRQELGMAKAASYASGILNTGTTKQFQNEMKSQWNADMAWAEQKNRLEQSIMTKSAKMGMDATADAGMAGLIGGIGAAAGAAAGGGLFDMFKKPATAASPSAISMTGDTRYR